MHELECPVCGRAARFMSVLSRVSGRDYFSCDICAAVSVAPRGSSSRPVAIHGVPRNLPRDHAVWPHRQETGAPHSGLAGSSGRAGIRPASPAENPWNI